LAQIRYLEKTDPACSLNLLRVVDLPMSAGDWTEEEQRLLEEGLVRAAVICNPREKWLTIAKAVGTRDARACAERFRFCREQALLRQQGEGSGSSDNSEEEEEDEEEQQEEEAEEAEDETKCDDSREAGDHEGGSSANWSNRNEAWNGRAWNKKRQPRDGNGKWWESNGWNGDDWKWRESQSWQDNDQWREARQEGEQEEAASQVADNAGSIPEQQAPADMDEAQQRAWMMRQEVEANRERLRLKQEREEQDQKRKDKKLAEEREEREKQRLERLEKQNLKLQEQLERRRLQAEREEQEEKAARAKAQQFNPGLSQTRMVGGKAAQSGKADWAVKANAGQRGLAKKRAKEEALQKQAAEVLANIAAGKGSCTLMQDEVKLEEDEDEGFDNVPNIASTSSSSSGAVQPAAAPTQPPPASKAIGGAPKSTVPPKASGEAASRKARKRWWQKLDGDCPISLAPLGELPQPPFGLQAEGTCNLHYFDARFLASFLLSSCDFIDPVNRRPLTLDECTALDDHLQRYHLGASCDASVADAFTLFERQRAANTADDGSAMHSVQREATAVLQHLFRFGSARRTDRQGRAIAYNDGGLTVVDDDDILASGRGGEPASSAPAELNLQRTTSVDFPKLADEIGAGSSEPDSRWARHQRPSGGVAGAEAFPSLSSKAPAPKAWGPKAATAAKAKAAGTSRGGKGRGGRGRR